MTAKTANIKKEGVHFTHTRVKPRAYLNHKQKAIIVLNVNLRSEKAGKNVLELFQVTALKKDSPKLSQWENGSRSVISSKGVVTASGLGAGNKRDLYPSPCL
ncbi:hypothetical protein EVAR_54189_1 [Eumeta japonica]|uniref:Uncharacterized protein n=1 Tax=Eumeta variegata TaxID=151549 RepID=A0A4C1Z8X0_EUMVA|nr:hypothetical protein EVAR_54189_1 [Eumeta japonica]